MKDTLEERDADHRPHQGTPPVFSAGERVAWQRAHGCRLHDAHVTACLGVDAYGVLVDGRHRVAHGWQLRKRRLRPFLPPEDTPETSENTKPVVAGHRHSVPLT